MKEHRLIPEEELHNFPFLYKFLTLPDDSEKGSRMKTMPHIAGRIKAIQNENARVESFYKCISRF